MSRHDIYTFDCGTTNWRIYRQSCEQLRPLGEPQRVALTTFSGYHLPAALLLDKSGNAVQTYGQNAYEMAHDHELRPYLRDAFKLCIGNDAPVEPLAPSRRYTHTEALDHTRLLLTKVLERLGQEKLGSLDANVSFIFAHPVHWGKQSSDGAIQGQILSDFAATIHDCFPKTAKISFVPEPEAALVSLAQLGQIKIIQDKITLLIDVGGGTSDFVAGYWISTGLQDVRYYGQVHGGGLYVHDPEHLRFMSPEKYEFMQREVFAGREYPPVF